MQDVTEIAYLEQAVTQQRNELLLARDQLTQQNARLEASNTELQRLDETKSSFVAIAAHELRTPLTAILGYLELLSGGDAGSLNDAQMDYLRTAEAAAHRLLRITNNLLDVTRLEAGRLELLLQPTDLAALVAAVAAEQASLLEAKSQRLSLQAPADLPPALCDAVRAGQIIGNLINNAGKFAPPDSTIDVRLSVATEPGYLQVSVTDQASAFPLRIRPGSSSPLGVSGVRARPEPTALVWVCSSPARWSISTAAVSGMKASPVKAPPSTSTSPPQIKLPPNEHRGPAIPWDFDNCRLFSEM